MVSEIPTVTFVVGLIYGVMALCLTAYIICRDPME